MTPKAYSQLFHNSTMVSINTRFTLTDTCYMYASTRASKSSIMSPGRQTCRTRTIPDEVISSTDVLFPDCCVINMSLCGARTFHHYTYDWLILFEHLEFHLANPGSFSIRNFARKCDGIFSRLLRERESNF